MNGSTEEEDTDLSLAQVDSLLDERGSVFGRRFPPPLEARFEAENGAARSRLLTRYMTMGASVYFLSTAFYMVVLGGSGWRAWSLVLLGAVLLAFCTILRRNPAPWLREFLGLGNVVIYGLTALLAFGFIPEAFHSDFQYLFAVTAAATLLEQRPRAIFGLLYGGVIIASHIAVVLVGADIAPGSLAMGIATTSVVFALGLMVTGEIDGHMRRNWLRSLGDRLRADMYQELSVIDPMTGLGNRRALEQWAEAQVGAADETVGLVIADIDNFKSYNDTFGHLAGDDCIRRVAGVLMAEARGRRDRVFRFGGEEFVMVLPGRDCMSTAGIAERVRRAIAAAGIPHRSPSGYRHVTASFGVASQTIGDLSDLDTIIATADKELYAAKQAGRNQVSPGPLRVVHRAAKRA